MLPKSSLVFLSLTPATVTAGLLPTWLNLNRRADAMCGVKGYDQGEGNYFWSASKQLASFNGCSARCTRSKNCQSFAYSNESCMLFNRVLADNFDADGDSDMTYYDASCIRTTNAATPAVSNATLSPVLSVASLPASTTMATTATRTLTRSIASATGTGGPLVLQISNGTGVFPATRIAPSSAGLPQITDAPSSDAEPAVAAAAVDSSSPLPTTTAESESVSGAGSGEAAQENKGFFPQVINGTLETTGGCKATPSARNATSTLNSASSAE